MHEPSTVLLITARARASVHKLAVGVCTSCLSIVHLTDDVAVRGVPDAVGVHEPRSFQGQADRPGHDSTVVVGKLRSIGVQRISVGSALAWAAYAGLAEAAQELLAGDSHDYYARALGSARLFKKAWGPRK